MSLRHDTGEEASENYSPNMILTHVTTRIVMEF